MLLDEKFPFLIFLAVCNIVALLIFFVLILRIIYLLIRKKNTNRAEKIGAIAIVSIVFNRTLQQAILTPIQVLVTNVQKLFYITYAYSAIGNNASAEEKAKILDAYPLNENVVSVQNVFDNYPIARLLTAIALSILLYFFITSLKKNILSKESQETDVQTNKSVFIYNSIISSILVLSLFLVVSVCITIPYLNQASKPTAFTIARLDGTLNDYSSKDSFIVVGINSTPFSESSVKELIFTDTVKKEFEKLNDIDKRRINNSIEDFEQLFSLNKTERFRTISNLDKFKTAYKTRENAYKRNLSVNFEKETQSIIVDKGELFQSSVRYFTDFVQSEKDGFDNTLQTVFSSDAYNTGSKQKAIMQIKDAIFEFAKNDKRDSSYNPYSSLYNLTPNFISYRSYIAENPTDPFIPTFVKNGSEWGFFGFMANYLIKTQSSELVLLMGMFGFGLLGASLLSFQQINNNGNFINAFKTKPLILNFGNVLARGFGAALVIYLATKGGLAIFSAGTTTDANGYILLLTCFVGAVFSERVWNRIRKSLYPGDKEKDINPQNGQSADNIDENPQTKKDATADISNQSNSEKQNPKPDETKDSVQ